MLEKANKALSKYQQAKKIYIRTSSILIISDRLDNLVEKGIIDKQESKEDESYIRVKGDALAARQDIMHAHVK